MTKLSFNFCSSVGLVGSEAGWITRFQIRWDLSKMSQNGFHLKMHRSRSKHARKVDGDPSSISIIIWSDPFFAVISFSILLPGIELTENRLPFQDVQRT
jgi:hypothetical protein